MKYITNLGAGGGTNINDALVQALLIASNIRASEGIPSNFMPIIAFLTDGHANIGVTNDQEIRRNVENGQAHGLSKVPIYGLAFGKGAHFSLLKDISAATGAFARKIFEASDASIQLVDFMKHFCR